METDRGEMDGSAEESARDGGEREAEADAGGRQFQGAEKKKKKKKRYISAIAAQMGVCPDERRVHGERWRT